MECAPSSQSKACHTTQSTANVLKHQLQDNPEFAHSHGGCQGSTGDMTLCDFAQLMPLSTFPLIELCDLRMEHFSQCRRCRQGSRAKNHDNQWWYRATTRSAALTLQDNFEAGSFTCKGPLHAACTLMATHHVGRVFSVWS